LDSNGGTRKSNDDDHKFSPNKHKLSKIKSNTKKEEVIENVQLPKNHNGTKERNNNA